MCFANHSSPVRGQTPRITAQILPWPIQAVTLEHVPKAIAFDLSSAPQKVAVLGFQGPPAARGTSNATALLNFVYDLNKSEA